MSMNMTGRSIEFRVKAGSEATIYINIKNYDKTIKNLNDTNLFNTAVWKVWKPDGTLIINGAATYTDRVNGEVSYTLQTADTVIANAGVWEGEVELFDISSNLVEQSETFNFVIEESY